MVSMGVSCIVALFFLPRQRMQKTERGSENEGRRTPPFEPHKRPVCRFYRRDG